MTGISNFRLSCDYWIIYIKLVWIFIHENTLEIKAMESIVYKFKFWYYKMPFYINFLFFFKLWKIMNKFNYLPKNKNSLRSAKLRFLSLVLWFSYFKIILSSFIYMINRSTKCLIIYIVFLKFKVKRAKNIYILSTSMKN